MATISETERYAELLQHVDHAEWWVFVIGASHAIEQWTGETNAANVVGLIEAKKRGVDLSAPHWRFLIWALGAEADFIERLERAVSKRPRYQPSPGT
jgi:hypothetical protein